MSKFLFVDTETVDIPQDTSRPINDIDNWPAIRQIAWIICNENREIVEQHNYVTSSIRPVDDSGVDYCPQETKPIHKIIPLLMQGLESSVYLIGHNVDYDAKVIAAEMYRLGYDTGTIESIPQICTMRHSVNYCYFAGRVDSRFPKLQELYTKLFHEPFINAHDAYCDIIATFQCFWALVDKDIIKKVDYEKLFTQQELLEHYNTLRTNATVEDKTNAKNDDYGVKYSSDGKRLISALDRYNFSILKGEYSIPDGVEVICDNAFWGSKELDKLVIPKSVKKIGTNAFAFCNRLHVVCHSPYFSSIITKPHGHDLYDIVNNRIIAFFDNPGGVECPSSNIFPDTYYQTVQIDNTPNGTLVIGTRAFAGSKIKQITIGEGVSIDSYAFYMCMSLVSIQLPETLTELPNFFLANCEKLQSINIPHHLKKVGVASFFYCKSLKRLSLPESVTDIEDSGFKCCEGLEDIIIPKSITVIKKDTFSHCGQLKKIEINNCIERIESNPFAKCFNLEIIGSKRFVFQDGALYDDVEKRLISYIGSSDCFSVRVGTLSIGDHAFYCCRSVTIINLPESIISIGRSSFEYCENMQSINLPEGIISIGESSFNGCKNLQSITIPSSIKTIPRGTFSSCESMKQLIIPYSVTVIEEEALYHCSTLTDLYVSNPNIWLRGSFPFLGCDALTNIYVPEGTIDQFMRNWRNEKRSLIREPGIKGALNRWWENRWWK